MPPCMLCLGVKILRDPSTGTIQTECLRPVSGGSCSVCVCGGVCRGVQHLKWVCRLKGPICPGAGCWGDWGSGLCFWVKCTYGQLTEGSILYICIYFPQISQRGNIMRPLALSVLFSLCVDLYGCHMLFIYKVCVCIGNIRPALLNLKV